MSGLLFLLTLGMHVFELPQPLRDRLSHLNAPDIALRVLMRATYKVVQSFTGNVPTFAAPTTYATFTEDVSSRLVNAPRIDSEKAYFPNAGKIDDLKAGDISLTFANPDEYFATTQGGAMIRLQDITEAEFTIQAIIGDLTTPVLNLFRGKAVGPPSESKGFTTFTVANTLWDSIKRPMLCEDYAASIPAGGQTISVQRASILATHREVNTPTGGHFCVYNSAAKFDYQGQIIPDIKNSNPDQCDLKSVVSIGNAAKPGKYVVEFTDAANYTVTYPDNSQYRGSVTADFVSPKLSIPQSSWTSQDGTGVKIELQIGPCMKGNPITIARNFIEKSLLGNWGAIPANVLSVKIDSASWDAAEARFKSYTVWVKETNSSNDVWGLERGTNSMPLSCLEFANRVLAHVGCFVQLRSDGLIGIVTPFLDGRRFWDLSDRNALTDITIEPRQQWNYITAQYGRSGNDTYTQSIFLDFRSNANEGTNEQVVSLPYYPAGCGKIRAKWLLNTYARRYQPRQVQIELSLIPQMAISLQPGDILRVVCSVQPRIQLICEIQSLSIQADAVCSAVLLPIQQHEGDAFELCAAHVNDELLW